MVYKPIQSQVEHQADNIPYIMEGQVVSTSDPDQMGRVKVWVPALDGDEFDIDSLPWAGYASPFMGFTVSYPAGEADVQNYSHAAYGIWAVPKMGATVAIFCMNGDPDSRYYFASTVRLHRNRSLPAGRNVDPLGNQGPWGDAGDGSGKLNPIQPAYANLRTQFQGKVSQSEAMTRGAYERNVAQAKTDKDGKEGYSSNPADPSYLDSQTYCWVTPGRHAIIMQDDPHFARLRLKTAEGHQVIFDDANERIYVSTAKGNTWFELDQDGHVNMFGAASMSFRTGGDFNVFADGNINMEAAGAMNFKADNGDIRMTTEGSYQVQATQSVFIAACQNLDLNSEATIHITSQNDMNLRGQGGVALTGDTTVDFKAGEKMTMTGRTINLNGPAAKTATQASCPAVAAGPTVVPGFEPWTRPTSAQTRGSFWKP